MTITDHPLGPIAAEALHELSNDEMRYELVDGSLRVREPAGRLHGDVAAYLLYLLGTHVYPLRVGRLYAAETGFILRRDPDTVRAPDVAFVSAARLAAVAGERGFFRGAPDLAVEVLSPDDRAAEVSAKIDDYVGAGTRLVWIVDPINRHVVVHSPDGTLNVARVGATLGGGAVLPDVHCAVADLFPAPSDS
jgi:Uma2 family endonuclease